MLAQLVIREFMASVLVNTRILEFVLKNDRQLSRKDSYDMAEKIFSDSKEIVGAIDGDLIDKDNIRQLYLTILAKGIKNLEQ